MPDPESAPFDLELHYNSTYDGHRAEEERDALQERTVGAIYGQKQTQLAQDDDQTVAQAKQSQAKGKKTLDELISRVRRRACWGCNSAYWDRQRHWQHYSMRLFRWAGVKLVSLSGSRAGSVWDNCDFKATKAGSYVSSQE